MSKKIIFGFLFLCLFFINVDNTKALFKDVKTSAGSCYIKDEKTANKKAICSIFGKDLYGRTITYKGPNVINMGSIEGCYCDSDVYCLIQMITKDSGLNDYWGASTGDFTDLVDVQRTGGTKICSNGWIRIGNYCYECETRIPDPVDPTDPNNPEEPSSNSETIDQNGGKGKCVIKNWDSAEKIDVCNFTDDFGNKFKYSTSTNGTNSDGCVTNYDNGHLYITTIYDGFSDNFSGGTLSEKIGKKVCPDKWVRKDGYCYKCDEYTNPTKPSGNSDDPSKPEEDFGRADCSVFKGITGPLWAAIRLIAPVLALVMGAVDFLKAVAASDEKAMNKASSDFGKRLAMVAVLFILTYIISLIVGLIGYGGAGACM